MDQSHQNPNNIASDVCEILHMSHILTIFHMLDSKSILENLAWMDTSEHWFFLFQALHLLLLLSPLLLLQILLISIRHLHFIQLENQLRNFSLNLVGQLMEGLVRASTGYNLYGGDLVVMAKIMVGAVDLTESSSMINWSDVDRILEVSMRSNHEYHWWWQWRWRWRWLIDWLIDWYSFIILSTDRNSNKLQWFT